MLHFYECPKMHLWIVVGDYNPTWATSKLCNFSSQGFTLSKFSNFGDESEGSYGWVRYLRIANLTNSKLVDFRRILCLKWYPLGPPTTHAHLKHALQYSTFLDAHESWVMTSNQPTRWSRLVQCPKMLPLPLLS